MSEATRERLQRVLDDVAAWPGVRGILLASDEGAYLLGEGSAIPAPEAFGASGLALHGAAQSAFRGGMPARGLRVIAERGDHRLVTMGVAAGLLLVALADAQLPLSEEMRILERTVDLVAQTVQDDPA